MSAAAPARVDWIERQLLGGGDLRLAHRYLDVLRARHLRGAHDTWGVSLGLSVVLVDARTVEIGEGLAYDARGRELLVPRPVRVAIPTALGQAGRVVVVLRSAGDRRVPQSVARVLADDPADLQTGIDVPVAFVDAANGKVDLERRPHVRSLAPPRIASGTVAAAGVEIIGSEIAFAAAVDTSRAGFVETPIYLVQALGAAATAPADALGPLLAVDRASATGFRLAGRYVFRSAAAYKSALADAGRGGALPFAVSWLGFVAPRSCGVAPAPDPDCARLV